MASSLAAASTEQPSSPQDWKLCAESVRQTSRSSDPEASRLAPKAKSCGPQGPLPCSLTWGYGRPLVSDPATRDQYLLPITDCLLIPDYCFSSQIVTGPSLLISSSI